MSGQICLIPKDLFIVGPTASGKSNLALSLAEELKLPIVNCDSLQFFKTLKVGTSYPSEDDFKKAEHLLFGISDAGDFFSAGEFIREFELLRQRPERKNQSFLITGGSGFYIKALETGMERIEELSDDMKHKISFLAELSNDEKIKKLQDVDSSAFKFIHPNDLYRVNRALEIFYSQGIKVSELGSDNFKEFSRPKLGLYLEKDELLNQVSHRVDQMLKKGLIEEVEFHLNLGLKDWKPLKSVGYKEVQLHLDGLVKSTELKDLIVKNTMYLAKRQMTWFRSDRKVSWFHAHKEIDKAKLWAKDWIVLETEK